MQSYQAEVAPSDSISFGPFRLFPTARVLEKDGRPLALGNRALDILIVLVEHTGEVVSNRELMSRVWRGLVVSPSNLRVHMNTLRKALTDCAGATRYIANVTGQGYCFVAPTHRRDASVRPPAESLSTIGKTTVATTPAHSLLAQFAGRACFVDLGAISDSKRVVSAIASALGLAMETESALLMECLRRTRMLLVLDNCEHVIDAAASIAERG